MIPFGREYWAIKIIKTAVKPLKITVVNNNYFNGNGCSDKMCLLAGNTKNKIGC